eukprot:TRINITY_DN41253_c0_g1_i1.p3 TRINITY_DN41253_c0_g1~~TRINITY_DN41253_c0_g1_i1.p3  ORF type:complete len:160 (+),score=55.29 TRINITY_DN41253_c0_g1_i1:62-541(+)
MADTSAKETTMAEGLSEAERRAARMKRFGGSAAAAVPETGGDDAKAKRQARFGTLPTAAPMATDEMRKKRQARFGGTAAATPSAGGGGSFATPEYKLNPDFVDAAPAAGESNAQAIKRRREKFGGGDAAAQPPTAAATTASATDEAEKKRRRMERFGAK